MAKPTSTKRRPTPAPPKVNRPGWAVPAVVVGCVVALFVAAMVVTRLGGNEGGGGGADVAQNRPVTVTGTALPVHKDAASDPAIGTVAPTVTGETFAGRPVQIGGTGRPAMVLFVAHWCPHCRREVPLLAPELGRITPAGVEVITVSTSVRDSDANYPPSDWLEGENWPSPVLADDKEGRAAVAYGLSGFPYYVLLDRDGKVVARDSGEKTVEEIEALLKRVAPTPA